MRLSQDLQLLIREELAREEEAGRIDEDTLLIDEGIIDSMALMRLISAIEERVGVRIPDEEILPENFQSVSTIEALVERIREQT